MKKYGVFCAALLFLCLLGGCGKREDPALLKSLEACDAACYVSLYRVCTEGEELHRTGGGDIDPAFYTMTKDDALLLDILVCEDFFGNLSQLGKDLTEYQKQHLRVYVSGTDLRTEPLHTWLREGPRKSFLCLSVMEDPPEWTADGENTTVFRLTAPDAFFRDDGTQESTKLRKSLRAYAGKHEKPRIPDAVWYGADFWQQITDDEQAMHLTWEHAITDFRWTEADCG